MFLSERNLGSLTGTLRTRELGDIPREAWQDIQATASLVWRAWVNLFPTDTLWDPFGATLVLSLIVGLVIWLVKIRPG